MLARVIADHEWAAQRLRQLAAKADNDSAQAGAAKGAAAVGRDLVALLMAAGIAPQRRDWRTLRDVEAMAKAMMCALVEEVGEERATEWAMSLRQREPLPPEVRLEAAA